MVRNKDLTPVQFADVFYQRSAVGVLLVAAGFALEVGEYVLGQQAERWFKVLGMGVSLAIVLVVFPSFVRFVMHCRSHGLNFAPEGYVAQMFRRACAKSFELTFIFLLVAEVSAARWLQHVPGKIFIDATLCVSLAIMGVTFLLLNRSVDDDEADEEYESDTEARP
jgi:hypothetical protein